MAKKAHKAIPDEIQGNRPYSEVRQGVGKDVKNDVLNLHDDPEQGGFVDDEVNAEENGVSTPDEPRRRTGAQPSA